MQETFSSGARPASTGTRCLPHGLVLAIGSLPHREPDLAVRRMLDTCPEAPCWPQLPSLGFQENMIVQFSEGIPCLQVDWEKQGIKLVRPESQWQALAAFYEGYLNAARTGDRSSFAVSAAYARGLYAFIDRLSQEGQDRPRFVKGQITGPLTFGLSILDEQGLPALYDDTLSDVVCKGILMKSLWQLDRLRPLAKTMILFVDEPILASFGSAALINLSRERAVACLKEVFSAIKASGAIVGSHCCGNTDWSLLIEAEADILNFDAYLYKDSIGLYADSVAGFLAKGGSLAWGIVPSESRYLRHTAEELFASLVEGIDALAARGIPRELLERNLLLTTSCGLGMLKEQEAEAAMDLLKKLAGLVRGRLSG